MKHSATYLAILSFLLAACVDTPVAPVAAENALFIPIDGMYKGPPSMGLISAELELFWLKGGQEPGGGGGGGCEHPDGGCSGGGESPDGGCSGGGEHPDGGGETPDGGCSGGGETPDGGCSGGGETPDGGCSGGGETPDGGCSGGGESPDGGCSGGGESPDGGCSGGGEHPDGGCSGGGEHPDGGCDHSDGGCSGGGGPDGSDERYAEVDIGIRTDGEKTTGEVQIRVLRPEDGSLMHEIHVQALQACVFDVAAADLEAGITRVAPEDPDARAWFSGIVVYDSKPAHSAGNKLGKLMIAKAHDLAPLGRLGDKISWKWFDTFPEDVTSTADCKLPGLHLHPREILEGNVQVFTR